MITTPSSNLTDATRDDLAAGMHLWLQGEFASKAMDGITLNDIADIMAQAYGDVLGMLVLKGAQNVDILALNARVEVAANRVLTDVTKASCRGSA